MDVDEFIDEVPIDGVQDKSSEANEIDRIHQEINEHLKDETNSNSNNSFESGNNSISNNSFESGNNCNSNNSFESGKNDNDLHDNKQNFNLSEVKENLKGNADSTDNITQLQSPISERDQQIQEQFKCLDKAVESKQEDITESGVYGKKNSNHDQGKILQAFSPQKASRDALEKTEFMSFSDAENFTDNSDNSEDSEYFESRTYFSESEDENLIIPYPLELRKPNYDEDFLDEAITIPVNGRKGFELGALYNARTDKIIAEKFWDSSAIESMRKSDFNAYFGSSIQETETFKNRSEMIGINPISALLLWCHESNDYLTSINTAPSSVSASLYCEKITQVDWLPSHILKETSPELGVNPNMEEVYVVVELKYGSNIIIEAFEECPSEDMKAKAQDDLKNRLRDLINDASEENRKVINCNLYESLYLKEHINTLEEAALSYNRIQFGKVGAPLEPMQALLVPITKLFAVGKVGKTNSVCCLLENCFSRVDEISILTSEIGKLIDSKSCQYFSEEMNTCKRFLTLLRKHNYYFQDDLKNFILKLRKCNDNVVSRMNNLFKVIKKSPFSYSLMKTWIDNKQIELQMLQQKIEEISQNNCNVAVGESSLEIDNSDQITCISFIVKVTYDDVFLKSMEKYFSSHTDETGYISLKSGIIDEKQNWDTLAMGFQHLVQDNASNKNVYFVIRQANATELLGKTDVFTIAVKQKTSITFLNNILSKPIEIRTQVLSYSICKVLLSHPELSSLCIKNFKLILSGKKYDEENKFLPIAEILTKKFENIFTNLSSSRMYQLQVIPISKGYVLPEINAFFVTPAEPNQLKIKTDKVGSTFIHFSWENIHKTLRNDNYVVKYTIFLNEYSTIGYHNVFMDSVVAEDKNCSVNVEDLRPNTKYEIVIEACGAQSYQFFYTGQQKEISSRHLGDIWRILFSSGFNEAAEANELSNQICRLSKIKERLENNKKQEITSFLLQLIASTEFNIFVKKCTKVSTILNGKLSSIIAEKLQELISPLDIYNESICNCELRILLHFLFKLSFGNGNDKHCKKISQLVHLFCTEYEEDDFCFKFQDIFSIFLHNFRQSFDELQQLILVLILQKYDIHETPPHSAHYTKKSISELIADLISFENHILQNRAAETSKSSYHINCLKYAMKYSINKMDDFSKLLSIFINTDCHIANHLQWFMDSWKESRLQDFIEILETTKNFTEFFENSEISKELEDAFFDIYEKKPRCGTPFRKEYLSVTGEKIQERFCDTFNKIFQKLKFEEYLEQYVSRDDIYSIHPEVNKENEPLPMLFLRNLMMLDYRCRSIREKDISIDMHQNDQSIFDAAFPTNSMSSASNNISSDQMSNGDIVLAAIIACDPFLLKDVFEKLAACQLAIPVILSNPRFSCVVYNLWSLKSIKKHWRNKQSRKSMEANVTSYSSKTISFCRFGQIITSKSKVVNAFLSSAQGRPEHSFFLNCDNDSKSLLNDGNIEVCWYTPEGSIQESLHDLTTIYNLRGSARNHQRLFDFLLEVSNILVIFIGKDPLRELEKEQLKKCNAKVILIQTELEGFGKWQDGNIVLHFCNNMTIASIANCICSSISHSEKQQNNLCLMSMEKHADTARKIGLGIDQDNRYWKDGNFYANNFIEIIQKFKFEEMKESVVPLQGKYWKSWAEKDKEEFHHKFRTENIDPQSYSSKLLEEKKHHRQQQIEEGPTKAMMIFMEALLVLPNYSRNFFIHSVQLHLNELSDLHLPQGYPLEIMDGNVSHVPITWLEKVFSELKRRLENARIYAVSILGVQSSGKSTFLNTMFGSRFTVSSGRCTRGVFVQLLPVKKKFRESLKCDYYFVIDTEGLRAPELGDSYHHDNEIATLISCLSNLTIINFWGQTFNKDMADVILIAAYAYMRMTEVKIKSSFHMIFAGVQDITAEEKNKLGVSKIIEEINEMIERVAKSEKRVDLCRGLRSIFPMLQESFEKISFPQFLPILWHSSMSPPESRYGNLVINLKESVMNTLKDPSGHKHVQTIQEFLNRLRDIWRAIKMENFVFGFRNTQAIDVYSQMQIRYEDGLKELRELFFSKTWSVQCQINELFSTGDYCAEELITHFETLLYKNLFPEVEQKSMTVIENLKEYISTLSNPDHGMMHLETFEMHLKKTTKQLFENEISRFENDIILQSKSKIAGYEKQKEYQKRFFIEARMLATTVRQLKDSDASLNEDTMSNRFEEIFAKFLREAEEEDSKNFKYRSGLLQELHLTNNKYLKEKLNLLKLNNPLEYEKYLSITFKNPNRILSGQIYPYIALQSMKKTQNFVMKYVRGINNNDLVHEGIQKLKFLQSHIMKVISDSLECCLSNEKIMLNVMNAVWTELLKEDGRWCFVKQFSMKVFVNFYIYALYRMEQIEVEKQIRWSLKSFFEIQKEEFRRVFLDDCTAANMEIRAIENYNKSVLVPAIVLRIKMRMGNEILYALSKTEVFSLKKRMFYEIEKDLLNQPTSELVMFSTACDVYVKKWITKTIEEICTKNGFLKDLIKRKADFEKSKIIYTLREVDEITKDDFNSQNGWQILYKKLKEEPVPQNTEEESKTLQNIKNWSFAIAQFIQFLDEFEVDNIYQQICDISALSIQKGGPLAVLKWFDFDPLENLANERIGCTAQCPFCGVKCAADIQCIEGNRHKASMHRPQGLTGFRYVSTEKLDSDICTFLVGGCSTFKFPEEHKLKYNIQHNDWIPYKDVHEIVFDWDIPEIRDSESTIFWQYLFAKHHNELAEEHYAKPADIPKGWYNLTRDEALRSLKQMHGINE